MLFRYTLAKRRLVTVEALSEINEECRTLAVCRLSGRKVVNAFVRTGKAAVYNNKVV